MNVLEAAYLAFWTSTGSTTCLERTFVTVATDFCEVKVSLVHPLFHHTEYFFGEASFLLFFLNCVASKRGDSFSKERTDLLLGEFTDGQDRHHSISKG